VFSEARALGVLRLGRPGGGPPVRRDLEARVAPARGVGLCTTRVTPRLGLTAERGRPLVDAGLDDVQLSLPDAERESAERIAGARARDSRDSRDATHPAAAVVRDLGVAFTVTVARHRDHRDRMPPIRELAPTFDADRLELASRQYDGWALLNHDASLATREQLVRAEDAVERAVARRRGRRQIVYVLPDYDQARPKPGDGGWGRI